MIDPATASEVVSLYIPLLFAAGALVLLVAWFPLLLKRAPLSLPIFCVLAGMAAFTWTPFADYGPHPIEMPVLVEKVTELIVIISLMGAGLKIDRPGGWRRWTLTARLLGITMPLTIAALALTGHFILGLGVATALLLAACLAPTDPVLASDVQIESPQSEQDDEVRFALTSEAGLNDSLAFPFVHLAIAASLAGFTAATWTEWLWEDVLVRLTVGTVVGLGAGKLFGWIIYRLPRGSELSRTGDGFVALGATLTVYAAAELLHGYGFLAVFLAGLTLRSEARQHEFNDRMHDFADETERLLMMLLLLFFGGMVVSGDLLAAVGWREIGFAAVALFIIRPLAGMIGMIGVRRPLMERGIIAFFGIRGLGSVYYLAYGINHGAFAEPVALWGVLAIIILTSIFLHGVTVTPMMRRLDARRRTAS